MHWAARNRSMLRWRAQAQCSVCLYMQRDAGFSVESSSWASRSPAPAPKSILVELRWVEDLSSLEHDVHCLCELGGDHRERLALAVLVLEPLVQLLGRGVGAQERGGQLPEGPLQMRVADLASGMSLDLAGRLAGRLDQAAVGQKLLHPSKAPDVLDL